VNVVEVDHFTEGSAVARELILLKVTADSKTRPEIMQICDIFRAKVIDVNVESVILEITGNDSKIKAFLDLVEPFGVQKMARTGVVALERGANS
jgi:acetolactate synthase-1/3 small subunit